MRKGKPDSDHNQINGHFWQFGRDFASHWCKCVAWRNTCGIFHKQRNNFQLYTGQELYALRA